MRFLSFKLFKHLHILLLNNSLYGLDDNIVLSWKGMQQFSLTAHRLPLVSDYFPDEIAVPLEVGRPAA